MTRHASQRDGTTKISRVRTIGVREEMRELDIACDIAAEQVRDDLVIHAMEQALEFIAGTVERHGSIWFSGSGAGYGLAVVTSYKLSTPTSNFERATRSGVLGMNVAVSSTAYGKYGVTDALAAELLVNARAGDTVVCFASDAGSQSLLTLARTAMEQLKLPVVVFAAYPGTPLIRYADVKIRIQQKDGSVDQSGFCVEQAHAFLANVLCNQIKRIARKFYK